MYSSNASGRTFDPPRRSHAMRMTWHDLLFMHWPISPESLTGLLPENLQVETFESYAWISVVPFRMSGVAPRWFPNMPWMSTFPELNVRTYVSHNGKPGVWFFTLDATNPVAVRMARLIFHLNYVDAKIKVQYRDNWIQYRAIRTQSDYSPAELSVDYRPIGESYLAEPGTLQDWLTSRYCMYAANRHGELFCGEIDHAPWNLRNAQAITHKNSMLDEYSVRIESTPALLQFAKRTDVVAWNLNRVR